MAEVLVFDNFEVTIIRSTRRKTAAIKVDLSGVTVRVPQSLAQRRIRALVAEKRDWVERKLEVSEQKRRAIAAHEERSEHLDNGSLILIQGRHISLDLREDQQMSVAEEAGQLIVRGPDAMSGEPEQRRALVEQWLYARAVEELHFCVNVYKQKVGASPSTLQIKDYRARWGSCKPDGSIQLNWRLIHAPMHIMDYVVVHELCHLLEMNHSPRFWSEVERVDPQYRIKRQWLKDNGWRLTL
jgi:predicted metal-dependent hydrolase